MYYSIINYSIVTNYINSNNIKGSQNEPVPTIPMELIEQCTGLQQVHYKTSVEHQEKQL